VLESAAGRGARSEARVNRGGKKTDLLEQAEKTGRGGGDKGPEQQPEGSL